MDMEMMLWVDTLICVTDIGKVMVSSILTGDGEEPVMDISIWQF